MVCYSRFFLLLPLLTVLFVFANDNQFLNIGNNIAAGDKGANNDNDTTNTELVGNKSESILETGAPASNTKNKVLVEVTDAIEDEEEDALVYTPAIAPATPHVFLAVASQSLHADFETLKNKPVESNPKSEDSSVASKSNKEPVPDHIVTDKVLVTNGVNGEEGMVRESHVEGSPIMIPMQHTDTTSVSATISQPLTNTAVTSIQTDDHPKVEDSNSNTNKENIELSKHFNQEDAKSENDSVDAVPEGAQRLNHDDKSIVQDDIAQNVVASNEDVSGGSLKQEMSETSEHANGSMNAGSSEEKINKMADQHNQQVQQSEDKSKQEEVITKNESNNISDDNELNITPIIPTLNNVDASTNLTTEDSKSLEEKDVKLPIQTEGEEDSSKTEKILDIKGLDPTEKQQKPDVIVDHKETIEDEEEAAAKDDNKLLSFAEWKKRLDKGKVDDDIVDSKSPVPKNKTVKKEKHKIRKNFASIDCGGKVVSANEGATNILSVLKEDKDEYMLNPCNVKAWFVVELCDRIQVDSIDMANFEMFSSTPETFNVYVTSRYPSGSWEKVGTFHAKPEKEIQTFAFEEKFYARYIKIEIKKYFGKEHYCPLSLLRVFGITEVEQFEDNDDQDNSSEDSNTDDPDQATTEQNSDEEPANIFQAAKNVVADLVNGMAKKLSGKSDSEMNGSGITTQGDTLSSVIVTVTALSKESVPEELENSTYYYKDSFVVGENFVDWEMWYYYRQQKMTCKVADHRNLIKKIKATVYFNRTSTNIHQISSASSVLNVNKTPSQNIAVTPHILPISKSISEINIVISLSKSEVTPSEVQKATSTIEITNTTAVATPLLDTIPLEKPTADLVHVSTTTTGETSPIPNTPPLTDSKMSTQSSVIKPVYNEETVDVLEFNVNETIKGAVVAEKIVHNISAEHKQNHTESNVTTSDHEKFVDTKNGTDSNLKVNDSNVEPQENTTDNNNVSEPNILEDVSVLDQASKSSIDAETQTSAKLVISSSVVENNTSTVEITSSPTPKLPNKKSDILSEPPPADRDTQTGSKTTSGSKESIIAKLNAKVKALQANLTMSMMYLDEMSEQYRTAVKEVDERHKKKYAALNVSIQQQHVIIKQQTSLIVNLTKQINELAFQIQNLTHTTQEQHQKIIETHATWVFLEISIILIFLLLCRGKPRNIDEIDNELDYHSRRFSEPSMIKSKEMWAIEKPVVRKQLSDPTGMADNSYCNTQSQSPTSSKKRKRKKNLKSNGSEIEINKCDDESIPGSTEQAGLIFGRGLFNGIAEAFIRKNDSPQKLSRQADALLDEVNDKCCDVIPLRKVRSSELPTIDEDKIEDNIPHSKSCSLLGDTSYKRYNKNRAAGRFG